MASPHPTGNMLPLNRLSPKEMAAKGEAIYNEKYRAQYEAEHPGKFVAIDINTGKAWVNDTPEGALGTAQGDSPEGLFHLIKVGAPGVYRVGYSQRTSCDWFI